MSGSTVPAGSTLSAASSSMNASASSSSSSSSAVLAPTMWPDVRHHAQYKSSAPSTGVALFTPKGSLIAYRSGAKNPDFTTNEQSKAQVEQYAKLHPGAGKPDLVAVPPLPSHPLLLSLPRYDVDLSVRKGAPELSFHSFANDPSNPKKSGISMWFDIQRLLTTVSKWEVKQDYFQRCSPPLQNGAVGKMVKQEIQSVQAIHIDAVEKATNAQLGVTQGGLLGEAHCGLVPLVDIASLRELERLITQIPWHAADPLVQMKAAVTGGSKDAPRDADTEDPFSVVSLDLDASDHDVNLASINMTAQDIVLVTALVLFRLTESTREVADEYASDCFPLAGAMLVAAGNSGDLLRTFVAHLPRPLIELCSRACSFLDSYDEEASEDCFGCSNIIVTINYLHSLLFAPPKPSLQPLGPPQLDPAALAHYNHVLCSFMGQTPSQRLTNNAPLQELHAAVFQLAKVVAPSYLPMSLVQQLLEALLHPVEVYAELELDYALRLKLSKVEPSQSQRPMEIVRAILSLLPHAQVFAFARRTQFLDSFSGVTCTVLKILSMDCHDGSDTTSSLPSSSPELARQPLSLLVTEEHVSDLYVNFTPASDPSVVALKTQVSHGVFDLVATAASPHEQLGAVVVPFSHLQHVMSNMDDVVHALQEPGKIRMSGYSHPLYRGMPLFFLTPRVEPSVGASLPPSLDPSDSLYGMIRFTFPIRHFLEEPFGKHWYVLGSRVTDHTLFPAKSGASSSADAASAVSREFAHTILLSEHPAFSLGNPAGQPGVPSACNLTQVPHAPNSGSLVEWKSGDDQAQWLCGRAAPLQWDQLKFAMHLPPDSSLVFEADVDRVTIDFTSHSRACAVLKGQHDGRQCACDVQQAMRKFVDACELAGVDLDLLQPCFSVLDFSAMKQLRQQANLKPVVTSTSATLSHHVARVRGNTDPIDMLSRLQVQIEPRLTGWRRNLSSSGAAAPSPRASLTPVAATTAATNNPSSASLLQAVASLPVASPLVAAGVVAVSPPAAIAESPSVTSPPTAGIKDDMREYDMRELDEHDQFMHELRTLFVSYLAQQQSSQPADSTRPVVQRDLGLWSRRLAHAQFQTRSQNTWATDLMS